MIGAIFVCVFLAIMSLVYGFAFSQVHIWPRGFLQWLAFTILQGLALFLVGLSAVSIYRLFQ